MIIVNELKTILEKSGLNVTDKQIKMFEVYFNLLIDWNQKINLTAITDKTDVYYKHFLDSLMLHESIDLNNQSILDVGSGAGFPSIPLKIMYPNLKITILDSLNKRIKFLTNLCEALGLNVSLVHGRAEDFKQKNHFDIVTARAVAPLNKLLELTIPFVKTGGAFIAYKGSKYQEELDHANKALEKLNAFIDNAHPYKIMNESRVLIKIKKKDLTPSKYPRNAKQIKNNPL